MLAIIVMLYMVITGLFAYALIQTFFGVFSFGGTSTSSGLNRLQQQFNTDTLNKLKKDKDKDKEDEMFIRLKIGIDHFVKRFLNLPILTNILLTPGNLKRIDQKLIWAGRPFNFAADQWISVNIFLALLIGGYTFFLYLVGSASLFIVILYTAASLFLPQWWLNAQIKARQDTLERELPNIINKLILATMSQSQIITALNLVVKHTEGILTDEIKRTLTVIRTNAGEISVEQAFWEMAQRCGTPQVTSFCTAIINSINVKASINKILKEQAENIKESRKAKNEEIINKTDTYLMFSAALGVIAIIILSTGPGFLLIMQGLGG